MAGAVGCCSSTESPAAFLPSIFLSLTLPDFHAIRYFRRSSLVRDYVPPLPAVFRTATARIGLRRIVAPKSGRRKPGSEEIFSKAGAWTETEQKNVPPIQSAPRPPGSATPVASLRPCRPAKQTFAHPRPHRGLSNRRGRRRGRPRIMTN